MGSTRTTIPFGAHAAIQTVAAPAVMAAPFLLGFGQAAGVIAFAFGVMLLGLALQAVGPRRTIPLSSYARFDAVQRPGRSLTRRHPSHKTHTYLSSLYP